MACNHLLQSKKTISSLKKVKQLGEISYFYFEKENSGRRCLMSARTGSRKKAEENSSLLLGVIASRVAGKFRMRVWDVTQAQLLNVKFSETFLNVCFYLKEKPDRFRPSFL